MAETIRIEGLEEVRKRLLALPREISGKNGGPLLAALRKMGRVIQADAKARVRKKSGTLADNIIVVRKKNQFTGTEEVNVTVRAKATKFKDNKANRRKGRVGGLYKAYGPLFYARFLEFGTSKMPAYPFLRPAFESHKGQLGDIFRNELSAAIDLAVRRLNNSNRV